MIPVTPQPEPNDFDALVRQPGLQWLNEKGIPLDQAPPDPAALPTYWRRAQKKLWKEYQGVCAYLCIYFEWPLGAQSTDHFIAKSSNAGQAYEWANYRLSCLGMNRTKNRFDDILDPFEIKVDTFMLNLASGEIKPNPGLSLVMRVRANKTIERLRLNDPETNRMRAEHYSEYLNGVPEWKLKKDSPFVWYEANRQGLL